VTLHPADAGCGISFLRTSGGVARHSSIPATVAHVSASDLCTAIGTNGSTVATVEHLLAALSALRVDNALIEVDGSEVPMMDGSAAPFVDLIDEVGVVPLGRPRRSIKVLKRVRVDVGQSFAEFRPHRGMRIEIEIDFASPVIGRQRFAADVNENLFRREMARARTFGFLADVEQLWARGLALGASLDNSVVVGEDRVVNSEGLRFRDEFVRHKALDAVGDLALIGAPIVGCYRSYRGGHRLNAKAVHALMADTSAWTLVEAPVHRDVRHGDLVAGVGVPAYAPESS
jgi:UDP-3-O-[3-hydroxymyristoyl] N-acetylglucosamine deacetylase